MQALKDDLEYEQLMLTEGSDSMSPEEKKTAENIIFVLEGKITGKREELNSAEDSVFWKNEDL